LVSDDFAEFSELCGLLYCKDITTVKPSFDNNFDGEEDVSE